MKKAIALALLLALVLSLCACAPGGKKDEKKSAAKLPALGEYDLYAGFARQNITPEEPMPMGGYSNAVRRLHQNVLDDLYVTAIALTDAQGQSILLMNWDGVRAYTETQDLVRSLIAEKTGVAKEHIFLGSTHTHSAPEMSNPHEATQRYNEFAINQALLCAQEALADRRPANMSAGSIEAEGLNFVRHYMTTLDDGTVEYFGDSFGTATYNETTTHTSQADPTMFMLYFDTKDGKDMALINWRAHPHFTGGASKYDLSSDWIGPFRDAFEYMTGADMLYFNGAAGNINEKSRISKENTVTDYKAYGKVLADYAIELIENNLEPVTVDKIQTRQTMFEGQVQKAKTEMYYKAKELQAIWNTGATNAQIIEMGREIGIRSIYHANAIVNNAKRGETETRELNAILLGDSVSMVTAPNELFDTNAVWLEENSPTKYTLTLGYTNGHHGYIPSALAWEHTSYETDITVFVAGTGEKYQECFLQMLKEMTGR